MSIADWSDEQLLPEVRGGHWSIGEFTQEVIRLRGELREASQARVDSVKAWMAVLIERDALAAQVSALRSALEVCRKEFVNNSCTTCRRSLDTCSCDFAYGDLIEDTAAAAAEWERALTPWTSGLCSAHQTHDPLCRICHAGIEAHDRALLAKERGMVACLHNALEGLAKWVKSGERVARAGGLMVMPHQFDLASKVLADGAAMAEAHDERIRGEAHAAFMSSLELTEHDAEVRAKALLDGARLLEKADAGLYAWASSELRALAKGETK